MPGASAGARSERPTAERPSRTLFIRNLGYDVTEHELGTIMEQFGPIKRVRACA
jgi:RNA recognition motif-containing protein